MRKGFTMIEIIFTIAVIGILASISAPKLAMTRDDARLTMAGQSLSSFMHSLQQTEVVAQSILSARPVCPYGEKREYYREYYTYSDLDGSDGLLYEDRKVFAGYEIEDGFHKCVSIQVKACTKKVYYEVVNQNQYCQVILNISGMPESYTKQLHLVNP